MWVSFIKGSFHVFVVSDWNLYSFLYFINPESGILPVLWIRDPNLSEQLNNISKLMGNIYFKTNSQPVEKFLNKIAKMIKGTYTG